MRKVVQAYGKEVVYEESFWTGKKTISINGLKLMKVKKNIYTDGTNNYELKGSNLTGVTLFGPETIIILEKLTGFQIACAVIPIILCALIGGAIGAIFGCLASLVVVSVARNTKSTLATFFVCIAATGVALVCWFIISMFLLSGLQPQA